MSPLTLEQNDWEGPRGARFLPSLLAGFNVLFVGLRPWRLHRRERLQAVSSLLDKMVHAFPV